MALQVYNTLSRAKETFVPVDPSHVRMYVCGPTVYDFAHIGNARPVVAFDVLYRLLRRLYPRVTYVRNITDVDDKIIARAKESGDDIAVLTRRYAEQYHADMAALGALPPDIEPRATEHISQMIAMIGRLIEAGHAYVADGHVLFGVESMAGYGRLSRHSREELIAGARVEVAPYKRDAADFVLWKPSASDQPGWDSPWGRGRPGWHLECSAMSETHLGVTFDIHGGGQDLIFPHHENEIAQSVCAHDGAPFVKYWMHNGYVTVEGEKMSKSLGNFYTVRQLLDDGWDGETIRLLLLSAHYRAPLDFSRRGLEEARAQLDRLYGSLRNAVGIETIPRSELAFSAVKEALEDDLNTPLALARMHELASTLNRSKDTFDCRLAKTQLIAGSGLLGLLTHDPEDWFKGLASDRPEDLSVDDIEDLIGQRAAARNARDFGKADRIRNDLAERGVVLEDKPCGVTVWKRSK